MRDVAILILVILFPLGIGGKTRLDVDGSLALPVVPSELRQPVDRADYVVSHFWDAMDWCDSVHGRDRIWLEQQFVNYLSVLPHAHVDSVKCSVSRLTDKVLISDAKVYEMLQDMAMQYLFNADSPMRSDELYKIFLECERQNPGLSDAGRERVAWMLSELSKNPVGSKAVDFRFTDRHGDESSLGHTRSQRDILLLFYDPECETCHEVMSVLKSSQADVTVVAICIEGDRETWMRDADTMPTDWIVGYPLERIDEIYAIWEMPTMLLLSSDGTVKSSHVSVEEVRRDHFGRH